MITFIVQKTDLLNGQVTRFPFDDLWSAKLFVKFRLAYMAIDSIKHGSGFIYDYKIKLLGYEC